MMQNTKKRVPNTNELAFIQGASKILAKLITDEKEIEQAVNGNWREVAVELYRAFQKGGEQDFWKSYDAVARDRTLLNDWREMVTIPAERVKTEEGQDTRTRKDQNGRTVFKLMSMDDVDELPDPEYLVHGILQRATVSLVFGESSLGKTFLALHFAFCVAYGMAWFGRKIRQGRVLYIYAENIRGLKNRKKAWLKHYGFPHTDQIQFIGFPVHLIDDRQTLLDTIRSIEQEQGVTYELVIVDTFSNCSVGVNQNDQMEINKVFALAHEIVRDFGCHVLVVHHSNNTGKFNGSMAFRNHVDTMIELKKDSATGATIMHNDKQREDELFKDILLDLKVIEVGFNEETLKPITSCVLVANSAAKEEPTMPQTPQKMLEILSLLGRASYGTWKKACEDANVVKSSSFATHVSGLLAQERVRKDPAAKGKTTWYEVVTTPTSPKLVRSDYSDHGTN